MCSGDREEGYRIERLFLINAQGHEKSASANAEFISGARCALPLFLPT